MHFLADHAIKSCHQSHSLPVRLLGGEGGLEGGEAGRVGPEIQLPPLCVCARPRWRRAGARADAFNRQGDDWKRELD